MASYLVPFVKGQELQTTELTLESRLGSGKHLLG